MSFFRAAAAQNQKQILVTGDAFLNAAADVVSTLGDREHHDWQTDPEVVERERLTKLECETYHNALRFLREIFAKAGES